MAEIYNTDRFAELYYGSKNNTEDHMALAHCHIAELLDHHRLSYAFCGGWAVKLRGGVRRTNDVDVAINANMHIIKSIFTRSPRVCFPKTHGTTCVQVFIRTGGRYESQYRHLPEKVVDVDIIVNGHLGTPSRLPAGSEQIRCYDIPILRNRNIWCVDVFSLFAAKLAAHVDRRSNLHPGRGGNDYVDLIFLAGKYTAEIHERRHGFNPHHKKVFLHDVSEPNVTWYQHLLN